MSCEVTPVFWQRQPVLPLEVQRFLRARLEAALEHPAGRAELVWPTVLGAPGIREKFAEGVPEELLLVQAARMLAAVGAPDPKAAFAHALQRGDTARQGDGGWQPHEAWGALGPLVSLRCGVALTALTGLPEDETYPVHAGVWLFNCALFHETHDALEALWKEAQGDLRQGLQGLILMTAGYHHQQLHNRAGMVAVWEDALERLARFHGRLETPWGAVTFGPAYTATASRLSWLQEHDDEAALAALFEMDRPTWELR